MYAYQRNREYNIYMLFFIIIRFSIIFSLTQSRRNPKLLVKYLFQFYYYNMNLYTFSRWNKFMVYYDHIIIVYNILFLNRQTVYCNNIMYITHYRRAYYNTSIFFSSQSMVYINYA